MRDKINEDKIKEIGTEKKEPNQKELLALKLFDKLNPEMITKMSIKDIDNISILLTLTQDENKYRKSLGYNNSLFHKVILNNLILRTSLNGWRSEQGVKIITSVLDENKVKDDNNVFSRLKGVLR